MSAVPITGIGLGCDYNPEQWSPDVWLEDVRLMREAGVDLVAVHRKSYSSNAAAPAAVAADERLAVLLVKHRAQWQALQLKAMGKVEHG